MKVLVFGSMNIDKVYTMPKLPEKGETLYSEKYELHVGGKGLNQAVSFAKSGSDVYMAGAIGQDGQFLADFLKGAGVKTDKIYKTEGFTGHAVIEVDPNGQNQMIMYRGANAEMTEEYCDNVLADFQKGDLLMLQHETNMVAYMIEKAHEKGITVAINPSPYVDEIKQLPLSLVDYLILNEYEGQCIAEKDDIDEAVDGLLEIIPNGAVVMTLGADGAMYADKNTREAVPAFKVKAVDTTGAGDTFTGYFLTSILSGKSAREALLTASAASAIVVTKSGAAETIPNMQEVISFLDNR